MADEQDYLQKAFNTLASDVSSDVNINSALEDRLMTEARTYKQGARSRPAMVAAGCILVAIAGTSVVAAGGIETIRGWFATAEIIEPDGTRSEREILPSGEFWVDDTHSYRISPESLDSLNGRKVILHTAPNDEEPSAVEDR